MIPAPFDYYAPESLPEALEILAVHADHGKLIAGGQSLVPLMKLRLARPKALIDLGRVPNMDGITEQRDAISIGALTTHRQLEKSALLKKLCPLLPQTATTIGDVQVRCRGTIGGSLAHSDPASDLPAAIVALGAEMKVVSRRGERRIHAQDFFLGLLTTAIEPDEILTEVKVPAPARTKTAYLKVGKTAAGFAVVGVAACVELLADGTCGDIALGLTGITDKAYRAHNVEAKLRGAKLEPKLLEEAAAAVTDGLDVNEDVNGTREYRTHLARVYTVRTVQAALKA